MPHFTTQRRVPYSEVQMFDLVSDVEAYPEFLPLCEALAVRERSVSEGKPVIIADMTVGYKSVHETFTSRVSLDKPNRVINVAYIDGPFSHLRNDWRFISTNTGSVVHFEIDYAFKSRMLDLLMGGLFDKAFRKFSKAFEDRAHTIYGEPAEAPDWLSGALRR